MFAYKLDMGDLHEPHKPLGTYLLNARVGQYGRGINHITLSRRLTPRSRSSCFLGTRRCLALEDQALLGEEEVIATPGFKFGEAW